MNALFEEISNVLRRMRNNGIGNQEREMLMYYAKAIQSVIQLEEDAASKLARVGNALNGRAMYNLIEANNQLVRAKKREIENWENLYNEVRRLMNN